MGRLSTEWREKYRQAVRDEDRPPSDKRFITSLILKLWNVSWDLWEHRNGIVHDKQNNRQHEQLNMRIREQVRLGHLNLTRPGDRARVDTPLEKLMAKPVWAKEAWVLKLERARIRGEALTRGVRGMQRVMRQFLARDTVRNQG